MELWLCVVWGLVLLDSIAALFMRASGKLSCWYSYAFPSLAEIFPLQNGWPLVYFAIAALAWLSCASCVTEPRAKCKAQNEQLSYEEHAFLE